MHAPSKRTAKIATALVTPLAVLAAGGVVWQGSHAAFSGQTRNSGNDWSTGSVTLTDDDKGASRFQVTNMLPGDTDTKCITVTANATVPGTVKGYAVNPSFSSDSLTEHIFVTLREGTGGSFESCAGFTVHSTIAADVPLSQFSGSNSYANAIGGWNVPAGVSSRTYEMTWKFDTAGMTQAQIDDLQGDRAGIDMQWELQSD